MIELKKKLKENNSEPGVEIEALKELLTKIQGNSEYFVEILKSASGEKFVNFQKMNVDSDEPQTYLDAMKMYFN